MRTSLLSSYYLAWRTFP